MTQVENVEITDKYTVLLWENSTMKWKSFSILHPKLSADIQQGIHSIDPLRANNSIKNNPFSHRRRVHCTGQLSVELHLLASFVNQTGQ